MWVKRLERYEISLYFSLSPSWGIEIFIPLPTGVHSYGQASQVKLINNVDREDTAACCNNKHRNMAERSSDFVAGNRFEEQVAPEGTEQWFLKG